ncbi:MAG: hypothetical protein BWY87_00205 [Deltaproteobacteria bacterium ADurb.Bin510]|nr:MAG: hypothetical protein BWY87_00205 [Deltaproteobacteria bacterium ADurb.Bin510]
MIWAGNEQITNPHFIYPGDKVIIGKDANGRTVIRVEPAIGEPFEVSAKADGFLLSPQLAGLKFSATPLTGSGKVIGQHDIGTMAAKGDTVLLKLDTNVAVGQRLNILALEDTVKDGKTVLGYLYQTAAIVKVTKVNDNGLVEAEIKSACREIEKGQIALVGAPAVTPKRISFRNAESTYRGEILDIYDGVSSGINGARFDLAFINLGRNQGAQTGSLLDAYKVTEIKEDPKDKQSPTLTAREYKGLVMVLDAHENTSMCLVLDSKDAISKGLAVGTLR